MRRLPILLFLVALAGCATSGDDRFPSLALREAERVGGTFTPPPPPPRPTVVPTATTDRLAALRGQAQAAHASFRQRSGAATARVRAARGAAVASENWALAQVALAGLEATRSAAMVALADLDRLYVAAAQAASATGGSAEQDEVARVRDEVIGWIAEEDRVLADLRSGLPG